MTTSPYPWSRELRRIPLDQLESRNDYLTRTLDGTPGDPDPELIAEHRAMTYEIARRSRTAEIERAQRSERFHPDHYQPSEHPMRRRRRKRRRRTDRNPQP